MKYIFIILLVLCCNVKAQDNNYQAKIEKYIDNNKPKTVSGEMIRSEYYKGLYNIYSETDFIDKGFMMNELVELVDKSLELETGKITLDEFELFRMKKNAKLQMHHDEMRQNQYQQSQQAINNRPKVVIPPLQLYQVPIQKTTNCISNRIGDTVTTNCR